MASETATEKTEQVWCKIVDPIFAGEFVNIIEELARLKARIAAIEDGK